MGTDDLVPGKIGFVGATFSLSNRFRRLLWGCMWFILARWTPPFAHKWRIFLLNLFGARVTYESYVYPDVKIWAPWNLVIKRHGTLARGVTCYNIAPISIGEKSVISQGAHLCTGTHDYRKASFPLQSFPITIEDHAWICADSFVGPGVTVHEGAILSAAGATFRNLDAWSIYTGNPAAFLKKRQKPQ
jgi:putative colanic acid biosynthesis acetyltransferase WcaF